MNQINNISQELVQSSSQFNDHNKCSYYKDQNHENVFNYDNIDYNSTQTHTFSQNLNLFENELTILSNTQELESILNNNYSSNEIQNKYENANFKLSNVNNSYVDFQSTKDYNQVENENFYYFVDQLGCKQQSLVDNFIVFYSDKFKNINKNDIIKKLKQLKLDLSTAENIKTNNNNNKQLNKQNKSKSFFRTLPKKQFLKKTVSNNKVFLHLNLKFKNFNLIFSDYKIVEKK